MNQNPRYFGIHGARRANLAASLLAAVALVGAATSARATEFNRTSLVTDDAANLQALGFPAAANVDPNLVNPWGISFGPATPFWVSDNGAGVATLYTAAGVPFPVPPAMPLVVTIAPPNNSPAGFTSAPTGTVFNNNTSNFFVTNGLSPTDPNFKSGSANFIFATENGTISGRSAAVSNTQTFIGVDNSPSGAVYKGLAIGTSSGNTFLYAANFRAGTIDVFDSTFAPASGFAGKFSDPNIPAGYAPFNVQVLGNKVYVTYAQQDANKHDDVAGAGHGFVDVFNLDGTPGLSGGNVRLISRGELDSPWGLALAPGNFGEYSNDLLVGNFGDGEIHAFDPMTGAPIGVLEGPNGQPLHIPGLWDITIGNGGPGVIANAIYFTAGLPLFNMPDLGLEQAGLFGDLTVAPEPGSLAILATGLTGLMWFRRRRRSPSIQI